MSLEGRLDLSAPFLALEVARIIREARHLIGWSQRELARRAGISQTRLSRIEAGRPEAMNLGAVGRVLDALGIRCRIETSGRHLDDRLRQRDFVHGRVVGATDRRLRADDWETASEVEIGHGGPRGWIDLLAFRPRDRSLLVTEIKSDLQDLGEVQRTLAFYAREAPAAARRRGWHALRTASALILLDSEAVAQRLIANRLPIATAFPGRAAALGAWLADPAAPFPSGPSIALIDPASRERRWLRPTPLDGRRRPPAYLSYADAVRQWGGAAPPSSRSPPLRGPRPFAIAALGFAALAFAAHQLVRGGRTARGGRPGTGAPGSPRILGVPVAVERSGPS